MSQAQKTAIKQREHDMLCVSYMHMSTQYDSSNVTSCITCPLHITVYQIPLHMIK